MTPTTPVRLHWRSLKGPDVGQSAELSTEAEARRAITSFNATQRGWCHWWFVAQPGTPEYVAAMDAELMAGRR